MEDQSDRKEKNYIPSLAKSVAAGIFIAIGGSAFLLVKGAGTSTAAASLLFAIGLFVICTRGYYLYTGKVAYVFEQDRSYLLTVLLIWAGNFIGTVLIALLERLAESLGSSAEFSSTAAAIVEGKLQSSPYTLFILAVLCNIIIYIAVSGYTLIPHEIGKYLSLIFGVTVFICAGTEHCIADMYYFTVSGAIFNDPLRILFYLLIITLGNSTGAVLMRLLDRKATADISK